MVGPFYHHGCSLAGPLRGPTVFARRLLRRLQRPFFFALQRELDRLAADLTAARQEAAAARHEATAARAEAAAVRAVADGHRTATGEELAAVRAALAAPGDDLEAGGLYPLGLVEALNGLERAARTTARGGDTRPLRVLFALASPCQMYSGIGRAIFETVRRCRGRIEYTFAVDDADARNRDIVADFCRTERLPIHVGRAAILPDCQDRVSVDLPRLIQDGGWDAVECVSFANSATNSTVLKHAGRTPIVYTPHHQPLWTVPATPSVARMIDTVHREMLRSAALVACDSPWEWLYLRSLAGPRTDCALLPLGFDVNKFVPGPPDRKPYLLFVGDLNEIRKRFPLAVQIFAAIHRQLPQFQLVVVGNKSDAAGLHVPDHLRRHVTLKGYVSEAELLRLNREAAGLLQPSDFEAFGLPILEALACGTPVFLSRRPTVTGVFGRYRGTVLLNDDAPDRMAAEIVTALNRGPAFVAEVIADRPRLAAELSWDVLTDRRVQAMRAATRPGHRAAA